MNSRNPDYMERFSHIVFVSGWSTICESCKLVPVHNRFRFLLVLSLLMMACGVHFPAQAFYTTYPELNIIVTDPCWVCDGNIFYEPTLIKRDSRFESCVHASENGDVLIFRPVAHLS